MATWSRPLDVDRLADNGAEVAFAVALRELPGVRAGVTGEVAGQARFTRVEGLAVVRLAAHGSATLECQRCMQPMTLNLEIDERVALVASEGDAARVPAQLEPVLAAGGRISIGELITEELLLTLPIVALHREGEPCAAAPPETPADAGHTEDTHKPFARLAELMKR
ncbi:MAG: DUF177 domain-containing protein [Gammaproteobacteria bacterium]|nr:DUF177 domain-containing protein [Gammaproteobacteria bacterium]